MWQPGKPLMKWYFSSFNLYSIPVLKIQLKYFSCPAIATPMSTFTTLPPAGGMAWHSMLLSTSTGKLAKNKYLNNYNIKFCQVWTSASISTHNVFTWSGRIWLISTNLKSLTHTTISRMLSTLQSNTLASLSCWTPKVSFQYFILKSCSYLLGWGWNIIMSFVSIICVTFSPRLSLATLHWKANAFYFLDYFLPASFLSTISPIGSLKGLWEVFNYIDHH